MKKRFYFKKALSLSELLLAAVILVIALSAILLEFLACVFLNDANRNSTRAVTHAQYIMEDIKDTSFPTISSKITNGDWDWDTATVTSQGLTALKNESINTEVSGTTLLDISVTVSWQDRNGRNRNVTLETLLAEP